MKLGVPAVLREAPSKTGARRAGHWRYRQIGRLQAERESERAQFSVRSALPAILSRTKILWKSAEQFANFCGELLARPRPNREADAGPNAKSGKRNAPTANWTLLPKSWVLALRKRASHSPLSRVRGPRAGHRAADLAESRLSDGRARRVAKFQCGNAGAARRTPQWQTVAPRIELLLCGSETLDFSGIETWQFGNEPPA